MSRKPIRRARKAATATSLAAFSTIGANPPRTRASRARRSDGKRPESGRSKVSGDRSREVQPRRRARRCATASPARGDRHAHVGRAELGQHRAVAIGHHRMDHRLRMHDDLDLRRPAGRTAGAPRSAPGPCSSSWRNRWRSWRPCPSWDGPAPAPAWRRPSRPASSCGTGRPTRSGSAGRSAWRCLGSSTWKIALCSESTGSSVAPDCSIASISSRPAQTSASLLASADDGAAACRHERRLEAGGTHDRRHHPLRRPRRRLDHRLRARPPPRSRCRPARPSAPGSAGDRRPPQAARAGAAPARPAASTELPATSASTR